MIDVIDGLKSVRLTSEEAPTAGLRVTIEFSRRAPVLPQRPTRVTYRSAKQGGSREILGTPDYTHSTALPFGGWLHHYRLSHLTPTESAGSYT